MYLTNLFDSSSQNVVAKNNGASSKEKLPKPHTHFKDTHTHISSVRNISAVVKEPIHFGNVTLEDQLKLNENVVVESCNLSCYFLI